MIKLSSLVTFVAAFATSTVRAQQESLKVGKFFNPPNALDGPTDYSTNPVWTLGEIQTIKYTTTYSNYTIDLWQESRDGGSATAGPSIFQTRSGAVTQFDWSVQAFEFDLSDFDVFFLWLSPLQSDDPNPLSVTSRYFNITRAPASTTTSSSSTSASGSSSTISPPSSSATQSTTSSPAVVSPTANPDDGLSAGASAGIGVGAAFAVIALVAGGFFLWRRRRRNSNNYQTPAAAAAATGPNHNDDLPEMPEVTQLSTQQKPPLYPVELESGGYPPQYQYYHPERPERVELDGTRRSELDGGN
ncbi:hypothetical protein F5Y00DRAFT_229370 [Daldinia vernicosa]|uniref:uncharacterized protein n=1 Tax=Daldinia vernicosa TaxID=114800 RepID=UPI00200837FE|nr:uncharacterized protein F5Y00DRAFT_229370 [Daldinia vernicosa]KAI0851834.1 hypothetical protein F5Y00DRAFT_229370 [Daldinia vernicosa]